MGSHGISITYRTDGRDRPRSLIRIRAAAGDISRGWLTADGQSIPVALGRDGIIANKREGDGGTPKGTFRPRQVGWRAHPHPPPTPSPPARGRPARRGDAGCGDPGTRHYNQPMRLDAGKSGDRLKREDHLYDFIVEI